MRSLLLPLALAGAALLPQDEGEKRPVVPAVGAPAPAFRLNDHEGRAVKVGGAKETWTVVAFYPKALTPG